METMSVGINVTPLTPTDRAWMAARADELWCGQHVISRGAAHKVAGLPGFIARIEEDRAGVATYRLEEDVCELVTIDALRQYCGVGTALLRAVEQAAGDRRLWLITTNDNIDAIRFYQRRGFVLTAVYPNAIEESRKLKPQIPRVGNYGIPIRDELLFTRLSE
ncbi:MAG: GNAT family N-acetyltransferase [Planctomycetota bacterium]